METTSLLVLFLIAIGCIIVGYCYMKNPGPKRENFTTNTAPKIFPVINYYPRSSIEVAIKYIDPKTGHQQEKTLIPEIKPHSRDGLTKNDVVSYIRSGYISSLRQNPDKENYYLSMISIHNRKKLLNNCISEWLLRDLLDEQIIYR
jgi:hypothetical protein